MKVLAIDNIQLNGYNVAKAIKAKYPETIDLVVNNKLYGYLLLFGIRVSNCDTGMPDDFLGGIVYKKGLTGNDYWDIIVTNASVDPSPKFVQPNVYFDDEARNAGGTAWVKEGQYIYYLAKPCRKGNGNTNYADCYFSYPAFGPLEAVQIYRWNPKRYVCKNGQLEDIVYNTKCKDKGGLDYVFNAKGEKIPKYESFDPSQAKLDTTDSTFIHRSWYKDKFWNDSAGCQVFQNVDLLWDLRDWALEHIKLYGIKNKITTFTYTLFSRQDFVDGYNYVPPFDWGNIKEVKSSVGLDWYHPKRIPTTLKKIVKKQ
jgi:hypothetical protein